MEPADLDPVLELVRAAMGEERVAFSEAYWRWKHETNPAGPSPCLVAQDGGGQLVGVRAFLRWRWRSGARDVPCVRAVDTATHPGWQGRGVFRRLTLALVEQVHAAGAAFVFNTPNARSLPGYLRMGWSRVGRVDVWVRLLRPWAAARRLVGLPPPQVDEVAEPRSTIEGLLDEPGLPALLARAAPDHDERYHTFLTLEHLRWRYARVPGFRYLARWDLDGEDGAAVIARRAQRGRFEELLVTELIVGRTWRGLRRAVALLRDLGREGGADHVAACAPPRSREALALAAAGFVLAPRAGLLVTARPLDLAADLPPPERRGSWRWSAGDLELL